jgi:hypothetical protein
MEDMIPRVARLETAVGEIRVDVAALKATVTQLATKAEFGELKALISATEASLIKWMVGTAISCTALAFAAAKLIA